MKRDERPTFSSRKMPKDHYRCLTVRFSPTFDESLSVIITEREEDKDVVDSCQRFLHWETTFYQKQSRLAHDLVAVYYTHMTMPPKKIEAISEVAV